jgi:intracellular sulfur oxidation DsrE/DsrF family protein
LLKTTKILLSALCLVAVPAWAGPDDFIAGETIPEYGKIANVSVDQPLSSRSKFKVAFDTAKGAKSGELNRTLTSAARFLNMHTAAGVKEKNISLAIVLHGGATKDATLDSYYTSTQADEPVANANAALVKTLIAHGVSFYVCGQSAAYYDVDNEDLLPGVEMSLSAMTAHAQLQQKGYTLNPF